MYISLTGIGPVVAAPGTGPFDAAAAARACFGHRADQSRGWTCGPRAAVHPWALPHGGWKRMPQPSKEQAMSPPLDFLQNSQLEVPSPLRNPLVWRVVSVSESGSRERGRSVAGLRQQQEEAERRMAARAQEGASDERKQRGLVV